MIGSRQLDAEGERGKCRRDGDRERRDERRWFRAGELTLGERAHHARMTGRGTAVVAVGFLVQRTDGGEGEQQDHQRDRDGQRRLGGDPEGVDVAGCFQRAQTTGRGQRGKRFLASPHGRKLKDSKFKAQGNGKGPSW